MNCPAAISASGRGKKKQSQIPLPVFTETGRGILSCGEKRKDQIIIFYGQRVNETDSGMTVKNMEMYQIPP
ncbi:MAG: hypothetical protein MSA26_06905 [Lachnospiraceae bacterium]|nr:hypothetical protein [Lachnospiraceae bacterium]